MFLPNHIKVKRGCQKRQKNRKIQIRIFNKILIRFSIRFSPYIQRNRLVLIKLRKKKFLKKITEFIYLI